MAEDMKSENEKPQPTCLSQAQNPAFLVGAVIGCPSFGININNLK